MALLSLYDNFPWASILYDDLCDEYMGSSFVGQILDRFQAFQYCFDLSNHISTIWIAKDIRNILDRYAQRLFFRRYRMKAIKSMHI